MTYPFDAQDPSHTEHFPGRCDYIDCLRRFTLPPFEVQNTKGGYTMYFCNLFHASAYEALITGQFALEKHWLEKKTHRHEDCPAT